MVVLAKGFLHLCIYNLLAMYSMKNYEEVLGYLYEQLPYYQRQGPVAYKDSLDNTLALDQLFGHPHRNFRTIHVAGNQWKRFRFTHDGPLYYKKLDLKTGLYTSPHLKDFRETNQGERRDDTPDLCR